jgi:hypothetical protein
MNSAGGFQMQGKLITVVAFSLALALGSLFAADRAQAHRHFGRDVPPARPREHVFYYYNGPPRAFTYPTPVGRHGRAFYGPWSVGLYGPGYGWPISYYSTYFPYHAPEGAYLFSADTGTWHHAEAVRVLYDPPFRTGQ